MNPHRHLDLLRQPGHPIRQGIPAVAVLTSDGRLIKATEGGELASARNMGDRKVLKVFETLGPGG
jgi:thioredoxin 1